MELTLVAPTTQISNPQTYGDSTFETGLFCVILNGESSPGSQGNKTKEQSLALSSLCWGVMDAVFVQINDPWHYRTNSLQAMHDFNCEPSLLWVFVFVMNILDKTHILGSPPPWLGHPHHTRSVKTTHQLIFGLDKKPSPVLWTVFHEEQLIILTAPAFLNKTPQCFCFHLRTIGEGEPSSSSCESPYSFLHFKRQLLCKNTS